MALSGPFKITHEVDQMLVQYRKHLRQLGALWTQASQLGRCGDVVVSPRTSDDMLARLEMAVTCLMEKGVLVERARQEVLDLKSALDISRQTVDAKSKHLGQEEKQKEEEQGLRFKEFKRIHRFQDEKASLEKELVHIRRRLGHISEVLDEKSEKMRNLENFYDTLSDHCEEALKLLKLQTDSARLDRAKWDRIDLDIGKEVREFPVESEDLVMLQGSVYDLSNEMQHHKQWYEDEMQTKLFYSTRSKEIKHKLAYYRSVLRRMESSGRSEELDDDADGRRLSRRSENILVDGSPGVQAKEVESYLSRQFGVRVLADYTMLKRLKDEIGVQGLAYLVEKVRLQGGHSGGAGFVNYGPVLSDWEEQRVEQALMGIALEYRDSEESKQVLRPRASQTAVSGLSSVTATSLASPVPAAACPTSSQHSSPLSHTPHSHQMAAGVAAQPISPPSASSVGSSSSRGSSSSLRRKSSLARIRKMLKI